MDPVSGVLKSKGRILVIDDDSRLRSSLRRVLEQEGYEVFEAPDGNAGLRLLRHGGADLVILDIYMPGRDGLEFLRDVRNEGPQTKVVAMSGGGDVARLDLLEVAVAFGALRTLSKPLSPAEVLTTVRELLEARA
ncbi:MAG TPA: response regulator [Gemmatimonadales bacterium]|nr:response regulator [Gemmatimonadales bacterium]